MGTLRAGVGRAYVNPPVGTEMVGWGMRKGLSIGVHDFLQCRAVVLSDDQTSVAIVALDSAGVTPEIMAVARAQVAALTDIPPANILVNCAHTHSSPSTLAGYYAANLTPAHAKFLELLPYYIAGAIAEAWHRRRPARIGAASTLVPNVSVNRRDPKLPVDPELAVIRIDDDAGRPMACLANFACHATMVGPHDLEWTADWPGYLARAVEEAIPGCACLFLQGAEGDIHPWDNYFGNEHPQYPDGYDSAERLGRAVAGAAAGLFYQIKGDSDATLATATSVLALPPRPISWSAAEAEAYLAHVQATYKPYPGLFVPDDCPACMSAQRYWETYLLSGARSEANFARNHPASVAAELNVVRINDILLATNPGELFSGLGMQIKRQSPAARTLVLSITNNWMGYIPTRDAAEAVLSMPLAEFLDSVKNRRHYGATTTTKVGPAAGEMVVAETLRLANQLFGR